MQSAAFRRKTEEKGKTGLKNGSIQAGLFFLLHENDNVDKSLPIDRMIDEDVPCEDILSQINAAKSALHKVGQIVLEGHIHHCVRDGIEHGDAEKTIENFTKAVERFSNMS